MDKRRFVYCAQCRKKMYEGEACVRHKHFTGFFCSFKCLLNFLGVMEIEIVTDELVKEDKECNGIDWNYEEEK